LTRDPTYFFYFLFVIFSRFLFPYFASGLNLYFTIWSPSGRNAVMLDASFFRCSCTSNMTFVIHVLQITSKNSIMVDGKHKINTLYHLYATGNLDKGLFSCFIVSCWTNCLHLHVCLWCCVTCRWRWISVSLCQCVMNKRWRSYRECKIMCIRCKK